MYCSATNILNKNNQNKTLYLFTCINQRQRTCECSEGLQLKYLNLCYKHYTDHLSHILQYRTITIFMQRSIYTLKHLTEHHDTVWLLSEILSHSWTSSFGEQWLNTFRRENKRLLLWWWWWWRNHSALELLSTTHSPQERDHGRKHGHIHIW